MKFAHGDPSVAFEVREGSASLLQVRAEKIRLPGWPSLTFPLSTGAGEKLITIRSGTDIALAGLWTFQPPVRYSPASTPFLSWWMTAEPALVVAEPIRFPLSTESCRESRCAVSFHVMVSPGDTSRFSVEGGESKELAPPASEAGTWRVVTLATGSIEGESPVVLRVEPAGSNAVLIQWIEAGPVPEVPAVASAEK
jgi:hypothetical protein